MIKKNTEQSSETRKNMRGGAGEVEIKHYFKKDEFHAPCRLCAQLRLAPGAGIGLHEHASEDEVFIIQQGKGVITDEDKEVEIEAGDAIMTGDGASHAIRNTGDTELLVTAVIIQY